MVYIFLVLTVNTAAFAQIGVRTGLNLATISDEAFENASIIPGFHVGALYEIEINDMISVEPGLLLSARGFKVQESSWGVDYTVSSIAYYLDLPFTGKYTHDMGATKLFINAGPYLGIGLFGKYTFKSAGIISTDDLVFGTNDDDTDDADYKRLDAGLIFGLGFEVKGFVIGGFYQLGLMNVDPDSDIDGNDDKIQHRVIGISLGYNI